MADPYATRTPDLSGRPVGPPPWRELIEERGGELVGADGEHDLDTSFVVVGCRGIGTLAPFGRVDPALAALLWIEHFPAARSAASANALLGRLRQFSGSIFAIKQGSVGGPRERPGCFEIGVELIGAVLDAALAGTVAWERDPDFGYEVPAQVAGVEGEAALALLPRLLYGAHDRVYEHAGLVAAKKRDRDAIASALPGLDVAIGAASGWPPAPSSSDWRE